MVIVPELKRLAYLMVKTTSKNDCKELSGNLAAIEIEAGKMGRDLRGIPFVLRRVKREVSTPPAKAGEKRVRREKWLLHIEAAPEWVAMQIEAAHDWAMLPPPSEVIDEDNGDTVDGETGEIINGAAEVVEDARPVEEKQAHDVAHAELLRRTSLSANTNQPEPRPFAPSRLAHIMGVKIEHSEAVGPISANQLSLLAGKLNEVWAGDAEADNNRRSVLKYLFAVDSAKELTRAQATVVLDWLIEGPDETGDYPLKPMAEREAKLVVRQYVEDAGQLTMEMGEAE